MLEELSKKQDEIIDWLLHHEATHPGYDEKLLEMRNIEVRISGIESRAKASRPGLKKGIEEVSIFHIN